MNITRTSKLFHVVIIGGAFAGIRAAKDLEELLPPHMVAITVIEKRDRYFYNLGALRSVAKSELIDLVWLPYHKIFRHSHNAVIQGEVESVYPNSVILKDGTKIDFDSLLVATGSIYPTPCKVDAVSHVEGKAEQHRYAEIVRAADSILVIGGGPTGVGLSAEIASAYPTKAVTLVHGGPCLLSSGNTSSSMSRKALKKLRSLGVNVHLNERIDIPADEPLTNKLECRWLKTSKGRSIFSNVQFLCNGITFSTTFMDSLDPAAKADIIDARTGQIRVLPTMQINHPELPWIFAAGDVCDTEGEKQAYRADSQGGHVAQCMARMAEAWCQGDSRWFKAPLKNWQDPAQYMSVPLGPDGGVTDTPWIVLGDLPTRIMKSRELFLARRYKEFNLEFPGVIKSVRGSISTGSAAANPTLTPPPSNTLNGCAATDASRLSRELSKPLANMALAAASRLDDKFESDRISLSRPALLATPSPSPNPSPIPSTTPSTNFRRDATPAARSTGYPYYDFRRSRRSPTVHGSESSDDCSSDEESSIYMGSCAPTSVYIQATPCTHCGHVNYSQIAFTSSVSVSSRSSKASISTAAPKTPATAMPFMREMPSAMHSGPVLPRKEKPPVSAAMMPPPSHKSHKSSSSHGGPSSHSTATIYLEQYQQV